MLITLSISSKFTLKPKIQPKCPLISNHNMAWPEKRDEEAKKKNSSERTQKMS